MKTLSRWLKWSLLAIAGVFFLWQLWLLAWVLLWSWVNPGETRFMEIRLAELRQKNPQAQLKQQWVPYERISPHLKRAIIAAEDAKFVDHEGFDWEGMQKALEKNQKKGASSPAVRPSASNWPRTCF
jgi:monofunctional biosynthetic peptidoglycan transglycosylase